MENWESTEGSSLPLGVTHLKAEGAYNFALYSRHATGVTLLLYSPQDYVNLAKKIKLDSLHNKSGRVWHCRVPEHELAGCKYYAYKVEGPFDPANGHRFDPQKVLLDPYAKAVFFPPAFSREAARRPGSNAGKAPLGGINAEAPAFDWGGTAACITPRIRSYTRCTSKASP